MKREIASKHKAASCYFRSSVKLPYRKALLQITEQCNLRCVHCFVSSGNYGDTMSAEAIRDIVIPNLKNCRVISVTLTGGEPFVHPDIIEIVHLFKEADIRVGICTNGISIHQSQIETLKDIGNVHLNVSLDGFKPESHGRFRGDEDSFAKTIQAIRQLGQYGLLQGLLVTPNNLAGVGEYVELCEFAVENNAAYVLMNPLSNMGRGAGIGNTFRASDEVMRQIRDATSSFSARLQIVYVRFPNDSKIPLGSCEAGNIIYVFACGEVTICPYLVFAARAPHSLHKEEEFIVGNIFKDSDIAEKINAYNKTVPACGSCFLRFQCGKGCPAAVIAAGRRIGGLDPICPDQSTGI